jgi:hypothetical protein
MGLLQGTHGPFPGRGFRIAGSIRRTCLKGLLPTPQPDPYLVGLDPVNLQARSPAG